MLRNKFRLKFVQSKLNENIIDVFNNNIDLAKQILRLDRGIFINKLSTLDAIPPLDLSNLVYLINQLEIKNPDLNNITPMPLKSIM